MFSISQEARAYIAKNGRNVLVTLSFQPSGGSCWRGDLLWGTYTPEIDLGKPIDNSAYVSTVVDTITVWYPTNLKIKQGYDSVKIDLKKLLFTCWLTIDGAQGVPIKRI